MQEEKYYSIRMRAAKNGSYEHGGKYISGGELLSDYSNINMRCNALLEKGLSHSRGNPDFMQIQFESIDVPIKHIKPLQIATNKVESVEMGQVLSWKFI